jgi:ferredoxin
MNSVASAMNSETHRVVIDGNVAQTRPGETLLDALLRHLIDVPFSCRGGVCQTCLLRCTSGTVPEAAQRGLDPELAQRGYLLPCRCLPESDMQLARPLARDFVTPCILLDTAEAGNGFVVIRFEAARSVRWQAGDVLELASDATPAIRLTLTQVDHASHQIEAITRLHGTTGAPSWINDPSAFGADFRVFGPMADPEDRTKGSTTTQPTELAPPQPDPELWAELGDGAKVREILLEFYSIVFRDSPAIDDR